MKLHVNGGYSSATSAEINEICTPLLKNTAVKTFCYQRYYDEGNGLFLTTDPEALENCLEYHIYPKQEELNQFIESGLKVKFIAKTTMLPILGKSPIKHKIKKLMAKRDELHDHIFFITQQSNYIRVCGFGTRRSSNPTLEFFINSLQMLEYFIFYFESKVEHLIKDYPPRNYIKLSSYANRINRTKLPLKIHKNLSEKLKFFSKHYSLDIDGKKIQLTHREIECLTTQALGYSVKEIGKALKISPKTVESHLYHAKQMVEPISKQRLRKILLTQGYIQFFTPKCFA